MFTDGEHQAILDTRRRIEQLGESFHYWQLTSIVRNMRTVRLPELVAKLSVPRRTLWMLLWNWRLSHNERRSPSGTVLYWWRGSP